MPGDENRGPTLVGSMCYEMQTNYRGLLPANVSTISQSVRRMKLEPRTGTSPTLGKPRKRRLTETVPNIPPTNPVHTNSGAGIPDVGIYISGQLI